MNPHSQKMDPQNQMFGEICSPNNGGGGDANETKKMKNKLFTAAMQNWQDVVSIYTANSSIRAHKITRSGDTVLHVAIQSGKKNIIKTLLDLVLPGDPDKILSQQNDQMNTPLHLAAAQGMESVCVAMAQKSPKLVVEARNKLGETPLFVAARYGKKDVFFAFQSIVEDNKWYDAAHPPETIPPYCRRNGDGSTILHVAITFEHFDLAFEIIKLYKMLVDSINVRGEKPLHCLANKPDVFRSASRFGIIDNLIFYSTFVNPMEAKYSKNKVNLDDTEIEDRTEKLQENYKICVQAYRLLNLISKTFFPSLNRQSLKKCCITDITDEEDPGIRQSDQQNKKTNSPSAWRWFPDNYGTCFEMLHVVMKFLLIVLGIGLWRTEEVQKKKRKHIYACQIVDEMLTGSRTWQYDEDGNKPAAMADALSIHQDKPPSVNDSPSTASQMQSSHNRIGADILRNSAERQISMDADQPSTSKAQMQSFNNTTGEDPPSTSTSKAQMQATSTVTVPETFWKQILDSLSKAAKEDVIPKNIIILGQDKAASSQNKLTKDTPILVAAKRGVTEIVAKILNSFPVAIQDTDDNDKNIVLLAVEYRQPNVYELMSKRNIMTESVFGKVDKKGNSALHLAATLGQNRPWNIPGAALQMQWEIKWFKFVQNSMAGEFFQHRNNDGKTAREIFTEMHEQLVKDGSTWLTSTSESCSVVAALIATVAFASATTVPGGINGQSGFPVLEGQAAFQIFALSALVALCFSVTSLIMFLSILTSRYQEMDFESSLPMKLILGLTSLFMSIASMLVSFCAGHFFVVEKKLEYVTYPIYAVMGVPVSFFVIAQFPLYVDLIRATFARVPEHAQKVQAFG